MPIRAFPVFTFRAAGFSPRGFTRANQCPSFRKAEHKIGKYSSPSLYRGLWTVASIAAIVLAQVAEAQLAPPGNTPLDNAGSGAISLRAPGNMVRAGVGRTVAGLNAFRGGVPITETLASIPPSPRAVFLLDAMEIIFGQVNDAILLFQNLLLLRAGQEPAIPTDTGGRTPPRTGTR